MSRVSDALKALNRAQRERARTDAHAEHFGDLDVDYLYRLLVERTADLAKALTADGNAEAPLDDAYYARVTAAAADAANAIAYLLARVTPRGGKIRGSSEAAGAVPAPREEPDQP